VTSGPSQPRGPGPGRSARVAALTRHLRQPGGQPTPAPAAAPCRVRNQPPHSRIGGSGSGPGPGPGPRQSAGVSGSRACDAESWQDSDGVAGVAAQRGGDVAVTVARRMPMARLRRLAMARGGLGGVFGEGGVADVVQCLDAPVAADVVREVSRVGLGGGEAGDCSWLSVPVWVPARLACSVRSSWILGSKIEARLLMPKARRSSTPRPCSTSQSGPLAPGSFSKCSSIKPVVPPAVSVA
jgi:hypothetical protein